MSEDTTHPGGWVNGIGWMAALGDCPSGTRIRFNVGTGVDGEGEGIVTGVVITGEIVIVVRWADGTTPTEPEANGLEPGEIVAVPADLRNDPDGVQWECYFAGYWLPVQADDTARRICRPITEEGQSC